LPAGCALERPPETKSGIADGDHHGAPPESLAILIGLHRNPASLAGMLHDVLTDFRQRHSEAHRGLRIKVQFVDQDGLRATLDSLNDRVDIVTACHFCDLEE